MGGCAHPALQLAAHLAWVYPKMSLKLTRHMTLIGVARRLGQICQ